MSNKQFLHIYFDMVEKDLCRVVEIFYFSTNVVVAY
jgi:hypothetical protein